MLPESRAEHRSPAVSHRRAALAAARTVSEVQGQAAHSDERSRVRSARCVGRPALLGLLLGRNPMGLQIETQVVFQGDWPSKPCLQKLPLQRGPGETDLVRVG